MKIRCLEHAASGSCLRTCPESYFLNGVHGADAEDVQATGVRTWSIVSGIEVSDCIEDQRWLLLTETHSMNAQARGRTNLRWTVGIGTAAQHRNGRHTVNRQLAMRNRIAGSTIVVTEGGRSWTFRVRVAAACWMWDETVEKCTLEVDKAVYKVHCNVHATAWFVLLHLLRIQWPQVSNFPSLLDIGIGHITSLEIRLQAQQHGRIVMLRFTEKT